MNRKRSLQTKLANWTSWLLMVVTFLITPATSIAATTGPEQFGPSSYLPALLNNDCSGQRAADSNVIGTQVYGHTGATRNFFTLLQDTQTVWIRNSIVWPQIEPTNRDVSQFIWSAADAAVQASVVNCAQLIITIENTPEWATIIGDRSPIRTEFLDDYRDFVTAVVERYDGDGGPEDAPNGAIVNYWEFYNEPDFGSEVLGQDGWGEYGARYAEMLETIYDAIHAANPNAKVVFGGIAYNLFVGEGNGGSFVREFFPNVLAAGGGEYFDIMNFHYYPFQHNRSVWTQTDSSGLREKYADIKAKLEAAGVGDKKIMITELGWHTATTNPDYPSNAEYQARRVLELLTQSVALGAIVSIWWTFDDQGPQFPYSTGLTTASTPIEAKPSYPVYLEAVKRIGPAKFDGEVSVPTVDNDLEAYRFREAGTNKPFYVAWLNPTVQTSQFAEPLDNNATQNLQVDGDQATIYNKDGTLKQTVNDGNDGENDGKITVVVGRSPIYIVVD